MRATLVTFHCGNRDSLVVLEDWVSFLGKRDLPMVVSTVLGREGNFQRADLASITPHAGLIDCETGGLGLAALDCAALFEGVGAAATEWVVMVKLDTLPYAASSGAGYLDGLIDDIEAAGLWGATGSFIPADLTRDDEGRAVTARYSNNYSIFRRDAWLEAITRGNPGFLEQMQDRRLTADSRYITEGTIESHLSDTGQRMLFLEDTADRSVLHINQWGDGLLRIRERYRRRFGVAPFLNRYVKSQGEPWDQPEWERYYGWPKPNVLKRLRIVAGSVRWDIMERLNRERDRAKA